MVRTAVGLSILLSLTAAAAPQKPQKTTTTTKDVPPPPPVVEPAPTPPPEPRDPKIAVLGLSPMSNTDADRTRAELLSEVMLTEAGKSGFFKAFGRSEIQALLGFERQKQLLGCETDSSCTAEIIGGMGADYLLLGSIGRIGELVRVDVRLIDTVKSAPIARVGRDVRGDEEVLTHVVRSMTREVLAPLTPPGKTLPEIPAYVSRSPMRSASYYVGGVGGALLLSGAFMGTLAYASYKEQEQASLELNQPRYDRARAFLESRSRTADILLGAGVLVAGAAAVMYFTSDAPVSLALAPTSNGLGFAAAGRF